MNQQRAGEGTTVVTGESTEQGYAIARPMPEPELALWLDDRCHQPTSAAPAVGMA